MPDPLTWTYDTVADVWQARTTHGRYTVRWIGWGYLAELDRKPVPGRVTGTADDAKRVAQAHHDTHTEGDT
jgi:hypothetical protein